MWTLRSSVSKSPDSTGTRDVYHENKIQFSRTEAFRFRVSPSREALSITPSDSVNGAVWGTFDFLFGSD